MDDHRPVSTYVEHLPAILRQGPFMARFLLAFEAVLGGGVAAPPGYSGVMPEGLEKLLERVHAFFDPDTAPVEFLPWLSQWAATSLRDDWSNETKRAFLGRIVPLYQKRGTRTGIEEVLRLCVGPADVIEFDKRARYFQALPLTVGEPPEYIVEFDETKPKHAFLVILRVSDRDPDRLARLVRQVREILDREKPAHTFYGLRIEYPAMQITETRTTANQGIIVGVTTVLGNNAANL